MPFEVLCSRCSANTSVAALCLASVAPLAAGYMLTGGYSWRLFFYVIFAFAVFLFILAFFFVEETSYDRDAALEAESLSSDSAPAQEKGVQYHEENIEQPNGGPVALQMRKSYLQKLSPWGRYDPEVPFFLTMIRSFSYFLVPQALWVITTYGIFIGLGAFVINFTFPLIIIAPPYSWDVVSIRLKFRENTGLTIITV
jgi:uncharacterized membrane protein